MLIISYVDLINKLRELGNISSDINSPYSIVLAVSKRAREINDGAEILVSIKNEDIKNMKPVSIAIREFYEGKLKIKTD